MAGRDLVEARRARPAAPRGPGGFDLALGLLAVMAVAGLVWIGVGQYLVRPPAVATAVALAAPWTEADEDACRATARAAAAADPPAAAGLANRAASEGFAGLATLLHCRLVTRAERFCDPAARKTLVAMVEDYLSRADLVVAGLAVQGAPMRLAGAVFGGEAAAGSDIYDMQREATLAVMTPYDERIVADLRALAAGGVLAAGDFAGLFGLGAPERITRMLGDVAPQADLCA
jgi:hypothetical protein